ncbi:hypothetical protein [Lentzea sp. NEAU-D7]|uniref:hypothetical protein n=1 Tax=Lentzea sp. NEAU-D7 TaxID=2994667 RepID=UPI00224AFB0F|nr:hypothetical protein [Lentzea sp. NEAU-D7]MCX2952818.1 hypothetical protein [Lentzea sp. NEAU-D7]
MTGSAYISALAQAKARYYYFLGAVFPDLETLIYVSTRFLLSGSLETSIGPAKNLMRAPVKEKGKGGSDGFTYFDAPCDYVNIAGVAGRGDCVKDMGALNLLYAEALSLCCLLYKLSRLTMRILWKIVNATREFFSIGPRICLKV